MSVEQERGTRTALIVIGVLIAIAIPTFIGARRIAQQRQEPPSTPSPSPSVPGKGSSPIAVASPSPRSEEVKQACFAGQDTLDAFRALFSALAGSGGRPLEESQRQRLFDELTSSLKRLSEAANRTENPILINSASKARAEAEALLAALNARSDASKQHLEALMKEQALLAEECRRLGRPLVLPSPSPTPSP